jgi:RND family efflux transporter MFP subunit
MNTQHTTTPARWSFTRAACLLALSAAAAGAIAAPSAQPLGCLIEPQDSTSLGSPVTGIVEKLLVDRGDMVKKGQVLAVLRADVERAAAEVARSRSAADAELQATLSNRQFAEQKFQRAQDLVAKNFLSQHALDEASNDLKLAAQKVALAREQLKILDKERGMAEAQLGLRQLRSPFDGIVTERYLSVGERMEEKPVFRLVRIDPLRVETVVPVSLFGSIAAGRSASVFPELASLSAQTATVTQVDQVIDAASNTFRVRLSLPNPGHRIPAGLRCKVEFTAAPAPALASTQKR